MIRVSIVRPRTAVSAYESRAVINTQMCKRTRGWHAGVQGHSQVERKITKWWENYRKTRPSASQSPIVSLSFSRHFHVIMRFSVLPGIKYTTHTHTHTPSISSRILQAAARRWSIDRRYVTTSVSIERTWSSKTLRFRRQGRAGDEMGKFESAIARQSGDTRENNLALEEKERGPRHPRTSNATDAVRRRRGGDLCEKGGSRLR